MNRNLKFGLLITLIVGTVVWLGANGISENQTYYKTVAEITSMGDKAVGKHLRVGGDVEPGSIKRQGKEVTFKLRQESKLMTVVYRGVDPLPDTFRDGAQALADGRLGPQGEFEAQRIQAKCASKYESKPKGNGTMPVYKAPVTKASL